MAFKDNTAEVKKSVREALEQAAHIIGGMMETNAKKNLTNFMWEHKTRNIKNETFHAAIDTGLLRNSITYAVSGGPASITTYKADTGGGTGSYGGTAPEEENGVRVYIGTNVQYRPYIELGTRSIPAVHFLQDAAENHDEQYKKVIDTMLNQIE